MTQKWLFPSLCFLIGGLALLNVARVFFTMSSTAFNQPRMVRRCWWLRVPSTAPLLRPALAERHPHADPPCTNRNQPRFARRRSHRGSHSHSPISPPDVFGRRAPQVVDAVASGEIEAASRMRLEKAGYSVTSPIEIIHCEKYDSMTL